MSSNATNSNNYTYSVEEVMPSRAKRFVEDLTAQIELKAARVAAGRQPADDLEHQFVRALQAAEEAGAERADAARRSMASPLAIYRQAARFAPFAERDLDQDGEVDKVDLGALHRPALSQFVTNWRLIPPAVDGHVTPKMLPDLVMPQAAHSKLKFRVNKVKCVEETSEWGDDEIYVGANFIDETGDTSYYYFKVSDEFDDGEVVDYGFPGKEIQWFNLKEGGTKFPKIYVATVSMVEKDFGKVSSWFQELADKINAWIKKSLKAAGIALGSLIGLGELGGLIGSIFGAIHDWLVGWIVGLFSNDYMGSFVTKAVINSYTGNWSSTGTSHLGWSKKFVAHGGHYHLWYTWELAA